MGSTGHKAAITYATSSITLPLITLEPNQESVEDVALPHLGLTAGSIIPYDPGDLKEGGEYKAVHQNDFDSFPAIGVKETITLTKPVAAGNTTGATEAFTGYIKSKKENTYESSKRSTVELVIKIAGAITKTAGT